MRLPAAPSVFLTAAALVALAGCSFQGRIAEATDSGTSVSSPALPTSPPAAPEPTTSPPTTPEPTTPTVTTPPVTTTGSPTACTTGQLVAALETAPAAPGEPRLTGTVVLTNISPVACRLKGFGGVGLNRSDGAPVLSRQLRSGATPTLVTLAPGQTARSAISWSRVPNTAVGEAATGDCEAVPTSLLVTPPNQIDGLAVPWTSGPVCDQGSFTQAPYTAP